ncbi:ankyrin [Lentithecium fluviatile CBS 122367]|uniref:Ankyrin n=1 Tax=Lentithecium fluviatile CBS 122367 TaxID=1168545 RepID=A0A6G1IK04_9PLEO|nr:ankyrin [Lentithecium fluviatile CBS 122367]
MNDRELVKFLDDLVTGGSSAVKIIIACEVLEALEKSPVCADISLFDAEIEATFLRYAISSWPQHFRLALPSSGDADLISKVLSEYNAFYFWLDTFIENDDSGFLGLNNRDITPLDLICRFGITEFLGPLLRKFEEASSRHQLRQSLNLGCFQGHLTAVNELQHDAASDQALSLTVQGGHFDVVKTLLSHGVSLNAQDSHDLTSLHYAAARGGLSMAKVLLENDAEIDMKTSDGTTPLHLAATTGQLELSQLLISKAANASLDNAGYDAMKSAAQSGFTGIVCLPTENGINLDKAPMDGTSPIHLAAQYGYQDTCEFFTTLSFSNLPNKAGWTLLKFAAYGGYLPIVQKLSSLCSPLGGDHSEIVSLFLTHGADISGLTPGGDTPLHAAIRDGAYQILEHLFQHLKPDANIRNSLGQTSLHQAAELGDLEMLWYLLRKGISASSRTNDGDTPLYFAARYDHEDILQFFLELNTYERHNDMVSILLRAGADTKGEDSSKDTPLHSLARSRKPNTEIGRQLLEAGAPIDARNVDYETLLFITAYNGEVELEVKSNHTTSLYLAAENGNAENVLWLLDNGADLRMESGIYGTPLNAGAAHKDVAELLPK